MSRRRPSPVLFTSLLPIKPAIKPRMIHASQDIYAFPFAKPKRPAPTGAEYLPAPRVGCSEYTPVKEKEPNINPFAREKIVSVAFDRQSRGTGKLQWRFRGYW